MKAQKKELEQITASFVPPQEFATLQVGDLVRLGSSRSGVEADIVAMHPTYPDYRLCAWIDEDTGEIDECYYNIRDLTLVMRKNG